MAMTKAEGDKYASALEGVEASYAAGKTDEFVVPFVVEENGFPVAKVVEHDSIIFFNFRPDRARELTRAFCMDEFDS